MKAKLNQRLVQTSYQVLWQLCGGRLFDCFVYLEQNWLI